MTKSAKELSVEAFSGLLTPTYFTIREIYLFGSRKSAKTKHVAMRMVLRCMMDKEYNGIAMRKASAGIEESIQEEIQGAINYGGVSRLGHYHKTKREFTYLPYKNRIKLRGISINPTSGKPSMSGLNVSSGGIKECGMEEAGEFTHDDYKMIRQTLRGGEYTIIITGNPYFQSIGCVRRAMELLHPILETLKEKGEMGGYYKEIRDGKKIKRLESVVHGSNFQINTKLAQADIDERGEEEQSNPKDFIVTGYGYPGSPSGTILGDLTDNIQERDLNYFMTRPIEYTGGVDIGLDIDATGAMFQGLTPGGEVIAAEAYYHNNGAQECNQYSDNGVGRNKSPHEIAEDVLDYFMMYEKIWRKMHPNGFRVSCDSADKSFISILNRDVKNRGIKGIKFIATKGQKMDKGTIESRIIGERQMLSRKNISFLVIKDKKGKVVSYPTRLRYEMDNIPGKRTASTGEVKLERDGSKVHPDITNSGEYGGRRWMHKTTKMIK